MKIKKKIRKIGKITQDLWYMRQAILPPCPDRKTVLIMSNSLYGGGAEKVACTLASEFAAEYRVIMLYKEGKGTKYEIDPDVIIVKLPLFREKYDKNCRRFVKLLKRSSKVLCSVSFMYGMNLLNVSSKTGEKVICSERNNPLKKEPEHMDSIKEIYHSADKVVFQTTAVRDIFDDSIKEKGVILPNPVSVNASRSKEIRHKIFTIGRLHPQKNQALLIRAFARLLEEHPEYTLELYGEGESRGSIEDLAAGLGIADSVFMRGNVPEVHKCVADGEMFVLSSDYEGFSNALIECMMMGFPCVSTDCEGTKDIMIDSINGLIVPAGDEERLYLAMKRLVEDKDMAKQIGAAAQKSAEPYKKEIVVKQWANLIETN